MANRKILHRIYFVKPGDRIPQTFIEFGYAWAKLHPEWTIHEWRHTADLPPLKNQDLFDNAQDACPHDWVRFRSDLLRLELLDQFGGMYADTDTEPLKPFDPLMKHQAWISRSPHPDKDGQPLLSQGMMAATPGHPFIQDCITQLPDAARTYRGQHLARMIGPHHVTRVWKQKEYDVTILPTRYFYPQSNPERDKGITPNLEGCYGWHRWNNSLKKKGKGLP